MKNSMLNKLKSGYEEMEVKASADLWEKLDHKLEAMPEGTSKVSFNGWKYAAVVLLLISFGTMVYLDNQNDSDSKESGYAIKKGSESIRYPEFPNPDLFDKVTNPEKEIKAVAVHKGKYAETKAENKTGQPEIPQVSIQHLAVQKPIISHVVPVKIEDTISSLPEVAVAAETKTTYISANELLLGREFDKTSKPQNTDVIKFGIFDFDKPKVENITVLGVTVYTDTK